MITLEKVWFKYVGSKRPVIRDLKLRIDEGELIVLTGPSGCGKSTLALLLCGFLRDKGELKGKIRIGDVDITNVDPVKLAGKIGLVQQDPEGQICTLRVKEELAFGPENMCLPKSEIIKRVDWAAEVVGIKHLLNRETTSLSGGEKQRLAIGSILAMKPNVIILDEPTSSLDIKGTLSVFRAIRELRKTGTTVLVIERKLHLFRGEAKILLMRF